MKGLVINNVSFDHVKGVDVLQRILCFDNVCTCVSHEGSCIYGNDILISYDFDYISIDVYHIVADVTRVYCGSLYLDRCRSYDVIINNDDKRRVAFYYRDGGIDDIK